MSEEYVVDSYSINKGEPEFRLIKPSKGFRFKIYKQSITKPSSITEWNEGWHMLKNVHPYINDELWRGNLQPLLTMCKLEGYLISMSPNADKQIKYNKKKPNRVNESHD